MTGHDETHLTEEQAAQLWQRAAMLQADAARAAESAAARAEGTSEALVRREGYDLEHVRAAAIEAGIGAEYLDSALNEMRAEAALRPEKPSGAFVRFFLDDAPDAVTAQRVIRATPVAVLKAMEKIVPNEPYQLSLKDSRGDVLNGGMLVFDIEGASIVASEGFAGKVSAADLREVYASLRSLDEGAACELTLRGPVSWARSLNAAGGAVFVGVGSGLGAALGWGTGSVLSTALIGAGISTVGAAVAATVITLGGIVGAGGLAMMGFRKLYSYGLAKGTEGLDGLLGVLAMEAEGGWGIVPSKDESDSAGPAKLTWAEVTGEEVTGEEEG